MTAEQCFQIANNFALLGWIILAIAVYVKNDFFRDIVAGKIWPLILSIGYVLAILFHLGEGSGGFSTLENVRKLFSNDWLLLAGWIHYLAFDIFVGSYLAAETVSRGLSRLILIPVLPLTFLFGPAGYLLFQILKETTLYFRKRED